uniref:Uncharacterized protein n=1 Tax=Ditylenchus dipsaci TaxID=166011 RepID=A0A915EIK8_9BILA
MNGRIYSHPNLYFIHSLEWCYAPSTPAEVTNIIEIVQHKAYSPESIIYFVVNFKKYTTVFGDDFRSLDATQSLGRLQQNLNCLLSSFQQWFAEDKVKNSFHLLITAECKNLEFRKQNNHTKEVLEFAKVTDELKNYQHMYCAPWSYNGQCDCSEQYMLRRFSV